MAAWDFAVRLYRYAWRGLGWLPLNLLCACKGRNVERCVLFVGYSRSGSTLLGALRNAHPEIVIAHELDLLILLRSPRYAAQLGGRGRLVRPIFERDRNIRQLTSYRHSGYSCAMKTGWQGKYSRLRVVGDKRSRRAAEELNRRPGLLDSLRRRIGMPIRMSFTIRNPCDVVAAECLSELKINRGTAFATLRDYTPAEAQRPWIGEHSDKMDRVIAMLPTADIPPAYYENFVAHPRKKLREICAFCDVECADDYPGDYASIVFPAPRPTRAKVRWSLRPTAEIGRMMEKHSAFLGRYARHDAISHS